MLSCSDYVTEILEGNWVKKQRSHRLPTKIATPVTDHHLRWLFVPCAKTSCAQSTNVNTPRHLAQDLMVVDFWERVYLPYCQKEWKGTGMRHATGEGRRGNLESILKDDFRTHTLQTYSTTSARKFLSSLKTKQARNTLRHIRASASAMFSEAVERGLRNDNP